MGGENGKNRHGQHARFAIVLPVPGKSNRAPPCTRWGFEAPDPMSGLTASRQDTTWAVTIKRSTPYIHRNLLRQSDSDWRKIILIPITSAIAKETTG